MHAGQHRLHIFYCWVHAIRGTRNVMSLHPHCVAAPPSPQTCKCHASAPRNSALRYNIRFETAALSHRFPCRVCAPFVRIPMAAAPVFCTLHLRRSSPPQQNRASRRVSESRARMGRCRHPGERDSSRHHQDAVQRAAVEKRRRYGGCVAARSFGKAWRVARSRKRCGFSCQQRRQLRHGRDDCG